MNALRSAAVIAALLLAPSWAGAAADARVEAIVAGKCALCHGADGESASAIYPRLAAQHPEYMAKQLKDFRDGRRKSDTMGEMARELTDDEITALARYFAAKAPKSRRPGDADLAGVGRYIFVKGNKYAGVPDCASCHGAAAHGTAQLPRLAGQHPAYLEAQLKEFNKRARSNDNAVMHSIASKLTDLEIAAVASYLGGLE